MTQSQQRWGAQSTVGRRWQYENAKDNRGLMYGGSAAALGGVGAFGYGAYKVGEGRDRIDRGRKTIGEGKSGIRRFRSALSYHEQISREADAATDRARSAWEAQQRAINANAPQKDIKRLGNAYRNAIKERDRYLGQAVNQNAKNPNRVKRFVGGGLVETADAARMDELGRMPGYKKQVSHGKRAVAQGGRIVGRGNMYRVGGGALGVAGIGGIVAAGSLRRRNGRTLNGDDPNFGAAISRRT